MLPILRGKLYKTALDLRRQLRVVSISPIDGRDENVIELRTEFPRPGSLEMSFTETKKKTTLPFSFLIGTMSSWHWTISLPRWNLQVSLFLMVLIESPNRKRITGLNYCNTVQFRACITKVFEEKIKPLSYTQIESPVHPKSHHEPYESFLIPIKIVLNMIYALDCIWSCPLIRRNHPNSKRWENCPAFVHYRAQSSNLIKLNKKKIIKSCICIILRDSSDLIDRIDFV